MTDGLSSLSASPSCSGRGGHAHVQVIPIPKTSAHLVEPAFRDSDVSFESSDDDEAIIASAGGPNASYFRVDLPDGRKLVHLMRPAGPRFDLQFGRCVALSPPPPPLPPLPSLLSALVR